MATHRAATRVTRGALGDHRRRRDRHRGDDPRRHPRRTAQGAGDVTVAAPVAPPDVVEMLNDLADRVVCLAQPDPFWAVGSWYRHFEAVTDDEVVKVVSAAYTGADLASAHQNPYR